jgi:hypothetical protein
MKDLERFLDTIPTEEKTIFDRIVEKDDFDLFLKHFLYVIILVSQGKLRYNSATHEIWRPLVPEAT